MVENYVWKIAGIDIPMWMNFTESRKEIARTWFFDIFKILQEQLKFSYEVVHPIPLGYGRRKANGSYSGMIGQIVNKVADITGVPTYLLSHLPVDYTPFIRVVPMKFIVAETKRKADWKSITRPFSLQLWIALGVSIMLLGIILPKIINYRQKRCNGLWTIQIAMLFLISSCSMKETKFEGY
ncbi:glutamate receptor ionotropic, delta-2-like isoform X2 [Centruroides sculpturatus]|uniref:glutamate receptor ionotropic, delta-2-like isoform X2 n=1 Tax=Centruroides sculpturatus TaxID=218467 RepID=UPI000C6D14B9|nr:glutamate receptor ionotropic, delta-2-like isoform X2 [Centruroides sculpturatus]XP_023211634.1 glutamate receptor ionotropic, delta-2-like isoform X2 [Centruroides sculpturatus]